MWCHCQSNLSPINMKPCPSELLLTDLVESVKLLRNDFLTSQQKTAPVPTLWQNGSFLIKIWVFLINFTSTSYFVTLFTCGAEYIHLCWTLSTLNGNPEPWMGLMSSFVRKGVQQQHDVLENANAGSRIEFLKVNWLLGKWDLVKLV